MCGDPYIAFPILKCMAYRAARQSVLSFEEIDWTVARPALRITREPVIRVDPESAVPICLDPKHALDGRRGSRSHPLLGFLPGCPGRARAALSCHSHRSRSVQSGVAGSTPQSKEEDAGLGRTFITGLEAPGARAQAKQGRSRSRDRAAGIDKS